MTTVECWEIGSEIFSFLSKGQVTQKILKKKIPNLLILCSNKSVYTESNYGTYFRLTALLEGVLDSLLSKVMTVSPVFCETQSI